MQKWRFLVRYLFLEIVRYNLIFTFLGAAYLISYGAEAQVYVLWLKLITFPASLLAYHWSYRQHLYFFHNLGFPTAKLILFAGLLDVAISSPIFLTTLHFL